MQGGSPLKKKKEKTWKVIELVFSLYIDHKWTNQIFYCQLKWVATAHSFPLVQRARLDARHCLVASCNVLVCQSQSGIKAKTCCPLGKALSAVLCQQHFRFEILAMQLPHKDHESGTILQTGN